MPTNTIINNPVNIRIQISKASNTFWTVRPSLTAFPAPVQPYSKNIIFLLDNSSSMQGDGRLEKVKTAVLNLLDQLQTTDSFSIVSFADKADILAKYKSASKNEIFAAKAKIKTMTASGGTSFKAAFEAVNTIEIIPSDSHSTIIFLTDGEDNSCVAENLLRPFSNKKFLRVIPIGVCLNGQSTLLNNLATLTNGGSGAIYIKDNNTRAYQDAFNTAFKRAMEKSSTPAQLEMTIQANEKPHFTKLEFKRELSHVCFDGYSQTAASVSLNSPTPPRFFKLRFDCDNMSLRSEYTLKPDEYLKLDQNQYLDINIPEFKSKNNGIFSWVLALGAISIGSLMLAGVAMFAFSSPMISSLMWEPLALTILVGLASLALFIYGVIALGRQTVFLPTKLAANEEIDRVNRVTPSSTSQREVRESFNSYSAYHPNAY